MTQDLNMSSALENEFVLLAQPDGTVLLQNTKTRQFICSGPDGGVYASNYGHDDLEKWTMTKCSDRNGKEGFCFASLVSQRNLACHKGKVVHTVEANDESNMMWTVDITSGELCFMSMPCMDTRTRCDIFGNLTMSTKFQGWEAWRFSEAGMDGHIRISPWAHREKLLSSDDDGFVCTTEERGDAEIWSVEKAPNGLYGVIIKSAQTNRVLRYDESESRFHTIPSSSHLLDESCVWDLESVHRQVYYIVASDSGRKLEAARKGLGTSGLPVRFSSEEWKIIPTNDPGVVILFSVARQGYLSSDASGNVFLSTKNPWNGSAKWTVEERETGFVILSWNTKRVLVAPENGLIITVAAGTMVNGSTRWKLEPKLPRQVNKEKVQAVGTAVAIGVAGTVATPFLIGGAIGVLGVAHVGVAGEIAIGSIRAVEALNTITRVTLSSSQLMISESSFLSTDSEFDYEDGAIGHRPFCSWRSW